METFILEDDPRRIKHFISQFGDIVHTDDIVEAKEILVKTKFDLIFLDHDLGGPFQRGKNGDGIDIAYFLAGKSLQLDAVIIIHSLNDVGSSNMLQALSYTHNNVHRIDYLALRKIPYEVIKEAFLRI